ncbi:MAG: hypothetical protein EB072_05785 [Betaproteobacteria bacterium]|nr:hypothetical protein [Betaproteobacteria bacterium]
MQKHVISLGFEGFGDRLQCLSYCLSIAIKQNRILCVNWRDRMWNDSFYRYFALVGVPYDRSVDFEGKSVFPAVWSALGDRHAEDWVYEINHDRLEDRTEDIIVHSGVGFRHYNFPQLARYLRIIVPTPFERHKSVVHLRGTDRHGQSTDLKELSELAGPSAVVSDDPRLVEEWMKLSPDSDALSSGRPDLSPFHALAEDTFERNCRVIGDWLTIALAEKAYTNNKESLFFQTATFLGTPEMLLLDPEVESIKSISYLIRSA